MINNLQVTICYEYNLTFSLLYSRYHHTKCATCTFAYNLNFANIGIDVFLHGEKCKQSGHFFCLLLSKIYNGSMFGSL